MIRPASPGLEMMHDVGFTLITVTPVGSARSVESLYKSEDVGLPLGLFCETQ